MRIGLAIHGCTHVPTKVYFNHLHRCMGWMKWAVAEGHEIAVAFEDHTVVAMARNKIVKTLAGLECDYCLFLDTDHIVDGDMLQRLFAHFPGPGMVSGHVVKRIFPFDTVAFKFDPDGLGLVGVHLNAYTGFYEVDGCAFGCTLIDMKKLLALPDPLFEDTSEGRSDLNLCKKFRAAGETLLVDTDVQIGHYPDPTIVTPKIAESLRAEWIAGLEKDG